jgi:hypothetical protein
MDDQQAAAEFGLIPVNFRYRDGTVRAVLLSAAEAMEFGLRLRAKAEAGIASGDPTVRIDALAELRDVLGRDPLAE